MSDLLTLHDGPDGPVVRLSSAPVLAQLAFIVLSQQVTSPAASAAPLALPDDPLARLELEASMQDVHARAQSIRQVNDSAALAALSTWASGHDVPVTSDLAWSWVQSFNGAYAALRSSALESAGLDCGPGSPAELDVDAEFAAFMGECPKPTAAADEHGWDDITVIFAVLTGDCLEFASQLG